ncbi:MAG: S1 RNA-binding domain-containing protein [Acidobacteria bacterium]|nr:S1 RNA-binding domain-containing protein [Acidobacteriota bacterium]
MSLPIPDPMTEETPVPDGPSFADILNEFEQQQQATPAGEAIEGTVLSVSDDGVFVDIGRKADGVLEVAPFRNEDGTYSIGPGYKVVVTIKGTNEQGQPLLTTLRVEQPKDWTALQAAFDEKKIIIGRVEEVIKGGLRVDVGARAFMPASRSGARDVPEMALLVGQDIECRVTKLDTGKEDVVVDRRSVLEEREREQKQKAFDAIEEGAVLQGTVRNLTDFGAFVDVGGVDGLLHVADISWTRIGKPADVLKAGDRVDVKVLKVNRETRKISLGMKQLQPEPWAQAATTFKQGERVKGTVARLTDFGAFVELLPGVEGLIHVSEMSWSKKIRKPADLLKAGEVVEVVVLNINPTEKRIALGLKQALGDPWEEAAIKFPKDAIIEAAPVVSIQKFGAFVELAEGIEGMIHVGDISHEKRIENPKDVLSVGQAVRCVVLEFDKDKRRIRLGMKQLEPTKADVWIAEHQVGEVLTGRVADIREGRAQIELGEGISGLCRFATETKGGASAANVQKVDVSSAASLLAAKFKKGVGAPETGPKLRIGETRSFRIAALDAQKKRVDLELA